MVSMEEPSFIGPGTSLKELLTGEDPQPELSYFVHSNRRYFRISVAVYNDEEDIMDLLRLILKVSDAPEEFLLRMQQVEAKRQ